MVLIVMEYLLEKEQKKCGHFCYPSTTPDCCSCMDLRPQLEGDLYPIYVDGKGWADEGTRNHGYCPVCNPKNFDVWEERIRFQREKKVERQKILEENRQLSSKFALEDKLRAAVGTNAVHYPYYFNRSTLRLRIDLLFSSTLTGTSMLGTLRMASVKDGAG